MRAKLEGQQNQAFGSSSSGKKIKKCWRDTFGSFLLGSFKLSYVSPENDKIGKSRVVEVGEKKLSLEAENGLPEFFVG